MILAISPSKLAEAKQFIQSFRRHLADYLEEDGASEVYCLEIALFPLTARGRKP